VVAKAAQKSSQRQKQKGNHKSHTNHFHTLRMPIVSYEMAVVLEDNYVPTAMMVRHAGESKLVATDLRKDVSHHGIASCNGCHI
jgi:hypothetical protein